MTIAVGEQFPTSIKVYENNPGGAVDLGPIFKGRKVIVFGVPGAFTPGCSNTHLPSYLRDYDKLKGKGVDEILCLSVNDAFVMAAWGVDRKAEGKIRFLADPDASLTKALGLDVDAKPLGGTRLKRFSAVVNDGKVTQLNVEPDSFGTTCSLAEKLELD